jgi:hypothetical protein
MNDSRFLGQAWMERRHTGILTMILKGKSEGKSEEGSENNWRFGSENESTDNRDDESGMAST